MKKAATTKPNHMDTIKICHLVSAEIDKDTKFHANISFRYIVDICYLQNHHFKVADKFFCHKHLKKSKSFSYLRHTNIIMVLKVTIPMKLSSSKIYLEEFSRKEWLLLFLVRLSMKQRHQHTQHMLASIPLKINQIKFTDSAESSDHQMRDYLPAIIKGKKEFKNLH